MLAKGPLEFYHFEGDEETYSTLAEVAVADKSSTYPDTKPGVVEIHTTDHGFKNGDQDYLPNYVFIQGTDNYDGLRRLVDDDPVDADSLYIVAKYVAETTATGDLIFAGLRFDEAWEFVGFKLHLTAACATTENFVVSIDSVRGTSFDTVIKTVPMNGVSDYIWIAPMPVPILANDIVKVTWVNGGDKTWGLTLIAQRLA